MNVVVVDNKEFILSNSFCDFIHRQMGIYGIDSGLKKGHRLTI
jgi:hypothetical protein